MMQAIYHPCYTIGVDTTKIKLRLEALSPHLNERMRRMVAAAETLGEPYGAVSEVSRATGVSRRAISQGLRELKQSVHAPQSRAGFAKKAVDEKGRWIATTHSEATLSS